MAQHRGHGVGAALGQADDQAAMIRRVGAAAKEVRFLQPVDPTQRAGRAFPRHEDQLLDAERPGLLLGDGFGEAIDVSAVHGAIVDIGAATCVPEPSTLALLMLGAILAPGRRPSIRGRRAAL